MSLLSRQEEARFAYIWADALAKHERVLGHRLDNVNNPPPDTAEALFHSIDRDLASFSEFRGKRRTLFNVLGGALKPIELISNVAAGGSSTVFPPSSLVFGAVKYLVDASTKLKTEKRRLTYQKAGHNVSSCYDAIIDLFNEVKDFTARLSVHGRNDITQELREVVTRILVSLIAICDHSAKAIRDGRVKAYFKAIVLGQDTNVQSELTNLRRLTESEERMVGALTLSVVTTTSKVVDEVKEQMSTLTMNLNRSMEAPQYENESDQLEQIRKVLKPMFTPQEIHDRISRKRVHGTGDWIQEEPLFQAWVAGTNPILWIFGGPGTGKSFLSSNIIDYFTHLYPRHLQDSGGTLFAYWFFKDYDPDLRSLNSAMRSLAYQICLINPEYAKHCLNILRVTGEIRSAESCWKRLLLDYFCKDRSENRACFLIDGLDEAFDEDRKELLELLRDLQSSETESAEVRLQVIMVGRPDMNWDIDSILELQNIPQLQYAQSFALAETEHRFSYVPCPHPLSLHDMGTTSEQLILSTFVHSYFPFPSRESGYRCSNFAWASECPILHFGATIVLDRKMLIQDSSTDFPIPTISVSCDKTSKDISEYIRKSLARVKILRRVSSGMRHEIETKLIEGADGMFLWVDLMIKELATTHKVQQIHQILAKSPKGLSDTLRHILKRFCDTMTEEEVGDFNELLAWIVCAKRPLTLAELEIIMCIKSSDGRGLIDLEGMPPQVMLKQQVLLNDFADELRNRYASFFTVVREDSLTTEDLQNTHVNGLTLRDECQCSNDDNYIDIDIWSDDDSCDTPAIESNPVTTVVHLAHASIGEFFRTNTSSVTGGVGININEAEVSILKTCLSLWCDETLWETWKCCFAYAQIYWPIHLKEINISLVSAENKRAIGSALMRTMRDEETLSRWVSGSKHREAWGHRDTYSSLVLEWFKDNGVTSDLSKDDKNWVKSLKSDAGVVHFIILEAARLWLKDNQWWWVPFFDSVWLHVERLRSIRQTTTPPTGNPDINTLDPAAIVEIARWAEFEENAFWYFKVGRILCSGLHFDEAIQYLEIALARNPKLFWAWATLANCYAGENNSEKAIGCQLDGIRAFHTDREHISMDEANDFLTTIHSILGDWYQQLGDFDLALESYKVVFHIDPDFKDTTMSILYLMERRKQHREIIDLLKELHADIVPGTNLPRLVQSAKDSFYFSNTEFYDIAVNAACESGELDFIRENMMATVKAARKSAKLGLLLFHLGLLTLRQFRDEPNAVHIWENVLKIPYASSARSDLCIARLIISRQLATRYFDRAINAGKGTLACNTHIEKLQNLTKWAASLPHEAAERSPYTYAPQDISLLLAKAYQLTGKESLARDIFTTHVKQALNILTDGNPWSDWSGCNKLFNVLIMANDDDHARATHSLLDWEVESAKLKEVFESQFLEDESTEFDTDTAGQTRDDIIKSLSPEGQGQIRCCSCGFTSKKPGTFHFCRMCLNVGFCSDCIKLIKAGSGPFLMCSPQHEFFHDPAVSERLPQGIVRYQGKEVSKSEWLEELKRDWGL